MDEILLKLEIPLNEEIYRKQLKEFFYFRWKKGNAEIRRSVFYVFIALLLAVLSYYGNGELSTFYIILVTILVTLLYFQAFHFFKSRRIYFRKIEKIIERNSEINNIAIVEFFEDHFYFRDKNFDIKISWGNTNFEMVNKLFIVNFEYSCQSFIFEEREIGKENFEKLISIVITHSKKKNN